LRASRHDSQGSFTRTFQAVVVAAGPTNMAPQSQVSDVHRTAMLSWLCAMPRKSGLRVQNLHVRRPLSTEKKRGVSAIPPNNKIHLNRSSNTLYRASLSNCNLLETPPRAPLGGGVGSGSTALPLTSAAAQIAPPPANPRSSGRAMSRRARRDGA